MVDYNSEGVLGTNRAHILDLVVLQRRDDFISSYENYQFSLLQNASDTTQKFYKLKSRLLSLWLELDRVINRRIPKEYGELKEMLYSAVDEATVMQVFNVLNDLLDQLNITRIDTRKNIDYTNIEEVNTERGL